MRHGLSQGARVDGKEDEYEEMADAETDEE